MPMSPQEREVITGIFERLQQGANAPREAEAEKLIGDLIARQPYAPYVMTQSLYVQEQALTNMQKRVAELEGQLRDAQAQKPASGGFLSGIFGGGSAPAPRSAAPQQAAGSQPGGPWGAQPQPQYTQQAAPQQGGPWGGAPQQPARGGGFMASALTTAAGVAGGMLAANALSSMFSGSHGQAHAADNFSSGFLGDSSQSDAKYNDGYQDAQQDAEDAQNATYARDDAYQDGVQDAADYSSDSGGSDSYDA